MEKIYHEVICDLNEKAAVFPCAVGTVSFMPRLVSEVDP